MTDGDVFLAAHRPHVDDGVGMYGSCEQWLRGLFQARIEITETWKWMELAFSQLHEDAARKLFLWLRLDMIGECKVHLHRTRCARVLL